ncbi:amino acid ABC transporter permease [Spirochaetota bacterium]|nr:amino acid ABC transporter permease [Spirochaetota bacterium]
MVERNYQAENSAFKELPDRQSPIKETSIGYWMRANLFSSFTSLLLTLISLFIIAVVIWGLLDWTVLKATWTGTTQDACDREGACWIFIGEKFLNFIYGYYPQLLYWRINLVVILFTLLIIPVTLKRIALRKRLLYGSLLVFVYPVIGAALILGVPSITCNVSDPHPLCYVPTTKWGGLMMTLILSYVGIVVSIPIGILLALGRMSNMPVIKMLSIIFIEICRGVPLITILFMASVVLPIFLPPGVEFNKLVRALIGIIFFQSAYYAEVVRGGLQAIPKGQHEAADAAGLNYTQKTYYITLPQALKIVIPSIVGTSISLAKDTSLVVIIGLFDVLAIVTTSAADSNWLGFDSEGYVFVAFIFWVFCYSMSRYSYYLERKYGIQKH